MPLTFLWGEEDFLIEKEINSIKKKVLGDNITELNYKMSDNPDFSELIFLLRSQPIMFSDTIICVKADRYFLDCAKKITLDERQIEEFINAIDLISDRVHFILTCPIKRGERKKPDSRKKIFKEIQKKGTIKEFLAYKPYEEYKILPVLKEMMREYNLKGNTGTLENIIRRVGPYFRDLNTALDKISLYIYPDNFITDEAVNNLYPASQNIFSLIDLILNKNYTHAINEISNMLLKSHYLEILAFLESGFSKLMMTKIYSKKLSSFDIAKKTGQNEYAVKMALNKLKNIELKEILKLKQSLINIEYEIKTGQKEPLLALTEGFMK